MAGCWNFGGQTKNSLSVPVPPGPVESDPQVVRGFCIAHSLLTRGAVRHTGRARSRYAAIGKRGEKSSSSRRSDKSPKREKKQKKRSKKESKSKNVARIEDDATPYPKRK